MYEYRDFSIYEDTLFQPHLFSVWHVKRDNEIIFHANTTTYLEPNNLFSLIRTVSGKADVLMSDGTHLLLKDKTVVILEKNKILSYEAYESNWEYFCYNFIPNTAIPYFDIGKAYEIQISEQERMINEEMFAIMRIYNNTNSNLAAAMFNELFFRMIYSDTKYQFDSVYYNEIQSIVQYINAHLDENPSITELAEKCNFSVRHFRHVFTEIVGLSPKNYITRQRFNKACLLLKTSTTSISDIAQNLGYYSQFQFSRDFKNQYGMTPSEYRRDKPRQ